MISCTYDHQNRAGGAEVPHEPHGTGPAGRKAMESFEYDDTANMSRSTFRGGGATRTATTVRTGRQGGHATSAVCACEFRCGGDGQDHG